MKPTNAALSPVLDEAFTQAHNLALDDAPAGESLKKIVELELAAFLSAVDGPVRLDGRPLNLDQRAFHAVSLVMHELVANAVKYGALSLDAGRLDESRIHDGSGCATITWCGPAVRFRAHLSARVSA